MENIDNFKLTSTVTVGDMNSWIASKDSESKNNIIKFINHIFNYRVIEQLDIIDSGFLIMAASCFTIETYESYCQGIDKSNEGDNKRGGIFNKFFEREVDMFPGFKNPEINFYDNIRCGILHQSDTKCGWRILMDGDLLDKENRTINAKVFHQKLRNVINNYTRILSEESIDSEIWKSAIKKLKFVCKNCERE